jgi:hypothetical protein
VPNSPRTKRLGDGLLGELIVPSETYPLSPGRTELATSAVGRPCVLKSVPLSLGEAVRISPAFMRVITARRCSGSWAGTVASRPANLRVDGVMMPRCPKVAAGGCCQGRCGKAGRGFERWAGLRRSSSLASA